VCGKGAWNEPGLNAKGEWIEGNWMLLCDGCDTARHTLCCWPALLAVPEGEWYCPQCCARRAASADSGVAVEAAVVRQEPIVADAADRRLSQALPAPAPLPPPRGGRERRFEVDRIMQARLQPTGWELLVRWRHFSPSDDSWEPEENLLFFSDEIAEAKRHAVLGADESGDAADG